MWIIIAAGVKLIAMIDKVIEVLYGYLLDKIWVADH